MKGVYFVNGSVTVDGQSFDWLSLPSNWIVTDFRNQCTTVQNTVVNGEPAQKIEVIAKP